LPLPLPRGQRWKWGLSKILSGESAGAQIRCGELDMDKFAVVYTEAIRKIVVDAGRDAVTAFEQMMGRKIAVEIAGIKVVQISEAAAVMGGPSTVVAGVYCRLAGALGGGFLLTFPEKDAIPLVDKIMARVEKSPELSEFDMSVLCEIGNIVAGSFVRALGKVLDQMLLISVPKCSVDMLGAVIDLVLIEMAEKAEELLIIEMKFEGIADNDIVGQFFLLPTPGTLELLAAACKK